MRRSRGDVFRCFAAAFAGCLLAAAVFWAED